MPPTRGPNGARRERVKCHSCRRAGSARRCAGGAAEAGGAGAAGAVAVANWAAALPGSILIGVFAPLWERPFATASIALAAMVTPLLAIVAASSVVSGQRRVLVSGIVLAVALTVAFGPRAELAAGLVTAFAAWAWASRSPGSFRADGCSSGSLRWRASTCCCSHCTSVSQPATLVAEASSHFHGRSFNAPTIGPITLADPDLVSAGVLGGFVAGGPFPRRAALALTALAAASGMLLAVIDMVPSTPPVAATFVLVAIWERAAVRTGRRVSASAPARLASAAGSASPGVVAAATRQMQQDVLESNRSF